MIAAVLLVVADPGGLTSAIDAERAVAAAAQREGQWAALRRYATRDAVLFFPQPASPHEEMPVQEPSIAEHWWPSSSFVSCDGSVAVNTGSWMRSDANGYFSTVWERQDDGGWKWRVDHGDTLAHGRALPETPQLRRAACSRPPEVTAIPDPDTLHGNGSSPDGTLRWGWSVAADGSRRFYANLWNGTEFDRVIYDEVEPAR